MQEQKARTGLLADVSPDMSAEYFGIYARWAHYLNYPDSIDEEVAEARRYSSLIGPPIRSSEEWNWENEELVRGFMVSKLRWVASAAENELRNELTDMLHPFPHKNRDFVNSYMKKVGKAGLEQVAELVEVDEQLANLRNPLEDPYIRRRVTSRHVGRLSLEKLLPGYGPPEDSSI